MKILITSLLVLSVSLSHGQINVHGSAGLINCNIVYDAPGSSTDIDMAAHNATPSLGVDYGFGPHLRLSHSLYSLKAINEAELYPGYYYNYHGVMLSNNLLVPFLHKKTGQHFCFGPGFTYSYLYKAEQFNGNGAINLLDAGIAPNAIRGFNIIGSWVLPVSEKTDLMIWSENTIYMTNLEKDQNQTFQLKTYSIHVKIRYSLGGSDDDSS